MEVFNKEDIYDSEISPLMKEIIDVCNKHEIPMVASFLYEICPERGPGRCTTLLNSFENRQDDAFKKASKIIRTDGHESFSIVVSSSK